MLWRYTIVLLVIGKIGNMFFLTILLLLQSRPLLNRAIENQEFDELVDPRLDGEYDDVEMFRVIEAAAACIRHSAARRPKMGQVLMKVHFDTSKIWQSEIALCKILHIAHCHWDVSLSLFSGR